MGDYALALDFDYEAGVTDLTSSDRYSFVRPGRSAEINTIRGYRTVERIKAVTPISWFGEAVARINELLELPAGWDSYGASRIHPNAALAALSFFSQSVDLGVPMPAIVPTADGGVQLEWHTDNADIEMRLSADTSASLFCERFELPQDAIELHGGMSRVAASAREALSKEFQ